MTQPNAKVTQAQKTWPDLPWDAWKDTCETLQMWMQIVGKVKLELTPFLNEWWEVGFDVSARGISTGVIPAGGRIFEMQFDFIDHKLYFQVSDGQRAYLSLYPRTVAEFYSEFVSMLRSLNIQVAIHTQPVETLPQIPFEQDVQHKSYEPAYAYQWWKILTHTTRVLQRYRSSFVGKSSPILFYWGSFDLSCTRFSGKPVPMPAAGPLFYRIAENQENVGCGFWPGNTNAQGFTYGKPAFYSYIYPAPKGIEAASVRPDQAYFSKDLGEFILDYEDVRKSEDPERTLLEFFQSTYEAAARLADWDRFTLDQTLESLTERAVKEQKLAQTVGKGGGAGASVSKEEAA